MNKKEFEKLYKKHTIKELCAILGCSAPIIYEAINRYGIKKKGRGNRKTKRIDLEY